MNEAGEGLRLDVRGAVYLKLPLYLYRDGPWHNLIDSSSRQPESKTSH